jgi:hypothetical protein
MLRQTLRLLLILGALFVPAYVLDSRPNAKPNSIAEAYVKPVLKVGRFDSDPVDSNFGPEEWKPGEPPDDSSASPNEEFLTEANSLAEQLREVDSEKLSGLHPMRYRYLEKQIVAVIGRIEMYGI